MSTEFQLGPFETPGQLLDAAIAHVAARGFRVTGMERYTGPEGERTTPGKLAREYGTTSSRMTKLLHSSDAPDFNSKRGQGGRFISITLNPLLTAYLKNRTGLRAGV